MRFFIRAGLVCSIILVMACSLFPADFIFYRLELDKKPDDAGLLMVPLPIRSGHRDDELIKALQKDAKTKNSEINVAGENLSVKVGPGDERLVLDAFVKAKRIVSLEKGKRPCFSTGGIDIVHGAIRKTVTVSRLGFSEPVSLKVSLTARDSGILRSEEVREIAEAEISDDGQTEIFCDISQAALH